MLDPLVWFWISTWASISLYGFFITLTDDKEASDYYCYGKSLDLKRKKGLFWRLFLLPKSYFAHFYVSALLLFLASFAIIILYYIPSSLRCDFRRDCVYFRNLLEIAFGEHNLDTADTLSSITALIFTSILMIIQASRRLYECLFISVYSSNSKINLIHYAYGHTFYLAAALSTLHPILFSRKSAEYNFLTLLDNLINTQRAIAFFLFVYASHHQQKCHKILANLRKDKSGRVISEKHFVPTGGPFQYVSCPHFLIESILYFLILVVQDFSIPTWNYIFLMVLSTQIINAIAEHRWYKKKYKDYPKERKAIFPKLL